jgi:hypothetical protein
MCERSDDPSLDRRGKDPVHLAADTYQVMAKKLEEETVRPISSFFNSGSASRPQRSR